MIRLTIITALGLGLSALVFAQERTEPRPGLAELERELVGPQDGDEAAEEGDEDEEIVPSQQQTFTQENTVILRALDKITGRSTDFEMEVGTPNVYGSLRIDLQTCFQTPP